MPKQTEVERITKAAEGRRFSVRAYYDEGLREFVVGPKCEGNSGHWFCVTHGEGFANQMQKDGHIHVGRHELAWICHEHGPEVP